jgi:hypothetical protein
MGRQMREWERYIQQVLSLILKAIIPFEAHIFKVSNMSIDYIFDATLAYECLTSVPFNPLASSIITTIHFNSKARQHTSKPTNELQQGVNNCIFQNHYEFEAALQTLYMQHMTAMSTLWREFSPRSL